MSTIDEIRRSLKGKLYEDPDFEACDENIFFSQRPPRPFGWLRPHEIVDSPKMFVGGASRLDIKQGQLGDCWLLAAVASLTSFEPLLKRVVPYDQTFEKNQGYCGAFKFTFWQEGVWTDVIIDDRLPTYHKQLVFLHSDEKTEFWSALLEKAYAKLSGSYEALKGGQTSEAMEDFTGGLAESIDLKKAPADLYKIIQKALSKSSLMGCSLNAVPGKVEAKGPMGLVRGHAYSLTGAKTVNIDARGRQIEAELVRVRNPWGNSREWEGDWGDKSSLWRMISDEEKRNIGLVFDDDGEFWMSFSDFKKYFDKLEICMLGPDSAETGSGGKAWDGRLERAKWSYKATAGGCRNFLDTFWTNPQFRVILKDPDDDEDVDNCSFVVSLMQCGRRKLREQKKGMLTMGFSIYEIKDGQSSDEPLDLNFFKFNSSVARSPVFINSREVTGRYSLPPGEYVVIASTFNPNEEGNFMVRLYSEKPAQTKEMDTETKTPLATERRPKLNKDQKDALNSKFYDSFLRLAGVDGAIDADELKEILTKVYGDDDGFCLEVCRSLIGLYDDDRSGKLGFEEFMEIWVLLKKWRAVFDKYDKDKSNNMDMHELYAALKELGITLSRTTKGAVSSRFRNKAGTVDFDVFVQIIARIFALNDAFDDHKAGHKAAFSREEFFDRTFIV